MSMHRVVTLELEDAEERHIARDHWDVPMAAAFVVIVSSVSWFVLLKMVMWLWALPFS